MGPVWLQYLLTSFVPVGLSVHHHVPIRGAGSVVGWASYLVLGLLAAGAIHAHRRGQRLPLWALGMFVVPLLPTSQLLAPLENLRADRYLLWAVLGPCVALGVAAARLRWRALALALPLAFAGLTVARAHLFADSVRLWQDASEKTRTPTAPYQLAKAYQEQGSVPEAEAAFAEAVTRARPGDDVGRAAANNLAASYASRGRLDLAVPLLRQVVERFPNDPRALNNLAEVTARAGQDQEARRLFDLLVRRFPGYQPGLANFGKRYGAPAPP